MYPTIGNEFCIKVQEMKRKKTSNFFYAARLILANNKLETLMSTLAIDNDKLGDP